MSNSISNGHGGRIFLIGFMGSGKSYWGRKWAAEYYYDFYDLDEVIESEQQQTIANLFEQKGEDWFRKTESEALRKFAEKDNCIIACGGGTACFNANIDWMNAQGKTVYLMADPQYIFDRVMDEQEKRPLIKNLNPAELLFFIEQKLKERESFYKKACVVLPVEELSESATPDFIINTE